MKKVFGSIWTFFIFLFLLVGFVGLIISPYMLLYENHKNQKLIDEGNLVEIDAVITDKYTLDGTNDATEYYLSFAGGRAMVSRKKYNSVTVGDTVNLYSLDGKKYKDSVNGFFSSKLLIALSFIISTAFLWQVIGLIFPNIWGGVLGARLRGKNKGDNR